jgi:hypothetical protein
MDSRHGKSNRSVVPAREDQAQPELYARQGHIGRTNAQDHRSEVLDQNASKHGQDAEKDAVTTEYQRLNFGPELP